MRFADKNEMRKIIFCFLLVLIARTGLADLFKWVDEEGTVHMTDSWSQVPPQYREQVDRRRLQNSNEFVLRPGVSLDASPDRLKHIEVPYQAFEGRSRRIIVPVTFNDSIEAHLLLDTGSPGLMISPALAARLGLLDESKTKLKIMAGGIGGSTPAILSVVDTVQVGEARSEFLPATIAQIPSDEFEGLVGMDFMSNYSISIDIKNSIIAFDELPPQADRPGGHDEAWWRSNFHNFEKLREDWANYVERLDREDITSSEKEKRLKISKEQYEAADKLCRKLERYARDNAVPVSWRR